MRMNSSPFRIINTLVLASFLTSCVTTHVGTAVPLAQTPVQVSCSYSPGIRTSSMSGLVCVLENTGKIWQDLKIRSIRFPDQNDVQVVSADDMRNLAEAYELKKTREDNNIGLALAGLVVAGALVAAGSKHTPTSNAGQAVMLGGGTVAVGRDVKKDYDSAQYGPAVYAREHILGGALRLPPELSLQRQLVINHPTEKPKRLEICWEQPKDACTSVAL